MLVLTRKINEEIKLGTEITVKIISISENQVKIGIEAAKSIQILRGEIYEKVKANTIQASQSKFQPPVDLIKYKIKKV